MWDWDCPEIEREKIKIEDKKKSAGFSTNSMNLFGCVLISLIDILIWVSLGQKYQRQPLGSPSFLRGNICPESCYHKFISFAAKIWRVGATITVTLQLQDSNSIVNNIADSWSYSYHKAGLRKQFTRTRQSVELYGSYIAKHLISQYLYTLLKSCGDFSTMSIGM